MTAELKKKFRIFRLIGNKKKKRKLYFDARNPDIPTFSQKEYIFTSTESIVRKAVVRILDFHPEAKLGYEEVDSNDNLGITKEKDS